MGLFKKVKKAFKKVTKGIGKAVKKVVKGVVKLGKKVVKGVGKFMGKLGPVGMIAIGILAPYALGALAGAGMGWASTAAQTLLKAGTFVKSAIAAPFKALGSTVGSAIAQGGASVGSSIGGSIGTSITSLTESIGTFLGGSAQGSITGGAQKIFGDVASQASNMFTDTAASSLGEVSSATLSTDPGLSAVQKQAMSATTDAMPDIMSGNASLLADTTASNMATNAPALSLVEGQTTGMVSEGFMAPADKFASAGYQPQDITMGGVDAQYELGQEGFNTKKIADGLKDMFGKQQGVGMELPTITDPGSEEQAYSAPGDKDQFGGGARSFAGQDQTGLLASEDFANQAFSLLNARKRRAA